MTIDSIPTRPNQGSDFGQGYSYSAWTPDTELMLCNVPWNSDYRDIVYFSSQAALDAYLTANAAAGGYTIDRATYARAGDPIRLNIPFNLLYMYNYIRVSNPAFPTGATYFDDEGVAHAVTDTPRTFYYFITNIRYIATNTTEITVQLDVWQTFGRNVTFGNCYVERGHIGIANENQYDANGQTYLTVPEGLDIGNEYIIGALKRKPIISSTLEPNDPVDAPFGILVVSTVSLESSYGTVDSPNLQTAHGSNAEAIPNGCECWYIKSLSDYNSFISYLSAYPWISQGIISISAVPPIPSSDYLASTPISPNSGASDSPPSVLYLLQGDPWKPEIFTLDDDYTHSLSTLLPTRYENLQKFLTYPYSVIEVTTYTGNPIILKPELIYNGYVRANTADPTYSGSVQNEGTLATINGVEIPSFPNGLQFAIFKHIVPPTPQISVIPLWYGAGTANAEEIYTNDYTMDVGEMWDSLLAITNLPQFSVVNNSYIAFMAQNAHRIAWSYQNADWSMQKALQGANVAFGQAGQAIQNVNNQASIGINARSGMVGLQNQQAAVGAAGNTIASALNGLEQGGPLGAIGDAAGTAAASALSMGIQNHFRNAGLDIANQADIASSQSTQNLMQYNADTNLSYAQFASVGDYSQAVAGINAKVQDMKLLQPSVSGLSGGDAAMLLMNGIMLTAKYKILQSGAMHTIGEFWLRYGYSISRWTVMPSNYQVMEKFTFWKLRETYITSSTCPEFFKQTIRGIFEKGVTVWNNPSDIGNIDIGDNAPLTGITL